MAASAPCHWVVDAALAAGNGNGNGGEREDDKISNSSSQHNVQTQGLAAEHAAPDGLPLHLSLLLGSHN